MKEHVVISGISGRFPESNNVEEFWENLINGVDMVTTDTRRWPVGFLGIPERKGALKADLTKFDANFFGVYPKQAERVDPQIRQLLEVTYEAIVDAGVNPNTIRGSNTGVYVGASAHDTFEACRRHPDTASGYDITGSSCCMLANRVSYAFDFHGPSFCVDTFCSSSLMALHQGMAAIEAGECDAAIIAGVNLLMNPMTSLQILRVGALAPDGKCKVFDESGNGFVRSEGIVALFIQKKNVALRSYANLLHSKTNTDGFKINGVSYPSGPAQQKLMEETYTAAGVDPLDVFYVEPHGTGTAAGDPQEVNAVTNVFTKGRSPNQPLLIGATKSNMGHAEPAAALCAVAKIVLSLQHGVIPGNLHYNKPNPNIPALSDGRIKVVDQNTPIDGSKSLIGVNSTGLGGANIHVIMEKNEETNNTVIPSAPVLIQFSGRTEDAVQHALEKIISKPRNANFESLLHKVAEDPTPGHPFRGFSVLGVEGVDPSIDVQSTPTEQAPLWFVFSGMGTLWKGMTKDLMDFEIFSESIHKSAEILKPFGLDLLDIMSNGSDELLNKNMGTCFVAMGVALIDMLAAVGLKPDGFIGHSAGELMCGYIDGCISQKDALICYFFKDECVANCTGGAMAAVGLSWEEAGLRCPQGIFPACHNSEKNVTVSGPADAIHDFVDQLKLEGIFAREVSTGGVAYHSPYLAPILPTFEAHTRAIVTNPRPRSSKWISSSIPEEEWDKPSSKMGSAEYVVNNMRSAVLFHGAVQHIPENAIVVEVSAHALFISMLKKALPPTCTVMGLIRKGTGNNAAQFLTAVGKLYQLGFNPKISALYKPVQFPVPVATPSISPLIEWDHSITFPLPDYIFNSASAGDSAVEVSLGNETDSYLDGHTIDGRILYPATGYLTIVWKKFASMNGKPYLQFAVEFENVRFERATILPKEGAVKFHVNINANTGDFQIEESSVTVVSGNIKVGKAYDAKTADKYLNGDLHKESKHLPLSQEDFYKEVRLQGYEYKGLFKGVQLADNEGRWAKIAWNDNWVSYLDTMLQFPVLSKESRGLFLPTKLQKATIDPIAFQEMVENNSAMQSEGVPVHYFNKFDITKCHGIEIKGLKTSLAARRPVSQSPVIEVSRFTPYAEDGHSLSKENTIKLFLDLVIENTQNFRLTILERTENLSNPISKLLAHFIRSQPVKNAEFVIVSDDTNPESKRQLEATSPDLKIISKGKSDKSQYNLLVLSSELQLENSDENIKEEGFIIYHSETQILTSVADKFKLNLIAQRLLEGKTYSLLRRAPITSLPDPIVINIESDNFNWLPLVKGAMLKSSTDKDHPRIYLTSTNAPESGILGLVNCLKQEPGGHKIRSIYAPGRDCPFNLSNPKTVQILKNDLAMNVIIGANDRTFLGSFRHFPLDLTSLATNISKYAYINVETKGDLSSLKFIEAPVLVPSESAPDNEICEVEFAPLNFRDVMLATGRLPPEALPGKLSSQECILGLEFVGRNSKGERVMGMVEAKGLATHVAVDPVFLWKVPAQWSMEEAATVPVAYSTAYYALITRGRLTSGESVLIHSGSGGVGQAAISIALSMNCTVYTSVGSEEKREFLKKRFPQLSDNNFTNSRDTTFEQHISRCTEGRGVDLVLNSLSEEKLQASVRCLAEGGRFLEIGKFDLSKNSALGMAVFLKNVTFHGILLDALFGKDSPDKLEVVALVENGIKSGTVQPLPRVVFGSNEIEDAFRFMASGKHMGKVLLKIKGDATDGDGAKTTVIGPVARVRTYFDPSKVYVIIGGLGGFGMELANWMAQREARKIVLVSRFGIKNGYQALLIRRWTEAGVVVSVVQTDVTSSAGAEQLIQDSQKLGVVGGIFNLAMVLKDGLLENQTADNFEEVTRPKVKATIHLDEASQKLCKTGLDHFVVFSSAAAGRGNAGQTNYGIANSAMERICENRKKFGLPALAIQWGAIGDVGVIQEFMGGNDVVLGGTVPQRLVSCLHILDLILKRKDLTVVSSTVFPESTSGKSANVDKPSLLSSVAKIMGLKNPNSVTNRTATLGDFGIDSLMAVELKQLLEHHCDTTLSTAEIRQLSWEKLEELNSGN